MDASMTEEPKSSKDTGATLIPVLPKPIHNIVGWTATSPGLGETTIVKEEYKRSENLNHVAGFVVCQDAINDTLEQGRRKLNLVLDRLNNQNPKRDKWPLKQFDNGEGSDTLLSLSEEEKIEFDKRRAEGDAQIEQVKARMESSIPQLPKGPQTRSGTKTGIKVGKKKK